VPTRTISGMSYNFEAGVGSQSLAGGWRDGELVGGVYGEEIRDNEEREIRNNQIVLYR